MKMHWGLVLGLQRFQDSRKSLPFSGNHFLLFFSHEMFLSTQSCIKIVAHFMRDKTKYCPQNFLHYLISQYDKRDP